MIPIKKPVRSHRTGFLMGMGVSENRRKGVCPFAAVLMFAQIKPAKINLSLFGMSLFGRF